MTRSSLYRVEGVSKRHSDAFTLHVECLDIAGGEVLCLVGPTGAGKSTLLRLLSGLEAATSGTVVFDGISLDNQVVPLSTLRRIAMLHQRPLVLSGTVRYNLQYGFRVRGVTPLTARVDHVLERLGLTKLAAQPAHTLSGGQTQLVTLARALVIEPDVLLLDEPTANLDPGHVALVEQVVLDIQRQRQMTIIWATHNLFQAGRVAHRVCFFLNGHLIEAAPKEQFFAKPTDERTVQFVQGKMVY
jgi:tungstate transport system ATP-binding protein